MDGVETGREMINALRRLLASLVLAAGVLAGSSAAVLADCSQEAMVSDPKVVVEDAIRLLMTTRDPDRGISHMLRYGTTDEIENIKPKLIELIEDYIGEDTVKVSDLIYEKKYGDTLIVLVYALHDSGGGVLFISSGWANFKAMPKIGWCLHEFFVSTAHDDLELFPYPPKE